MTLEKIFALVGAMIFVLTPIVSMYPTLLRWLAAHLLIQAGAVETAREYRKRQSASVMSTCGLQRETQKENQCQ